nr:protein kinase [Ardenticatenales bacterium]
MRIKIWGARGSIPTPQTSQAIRDKIISALEGAAELDLDDPEAISAYVESLPLHIRGTIGGNTACIEVEADGQTMILDAGSGIRALGQALMAGPCGRGEGVVHLFLSHTHWDHIQGFPFFLPAFVPGNRIYIYSIHDVAPTLASQMSLDTSSIPYDEMAATLRYIRLSAGEVLTLGRVSISNLLLPHPGDAYAYRLDHQGVTFVYASDAEYKHLDKANLEPYLRFYAGADALIFDAQFTLRESLTKPDWGHSSALYGVDIARRAGVKRLILFHHDPMSADSSLSSSLEETLAVQHKYEEIPSCEVILGSEGLELELAPTRSPSRALSMAYRIDCLEGNHTAILRLAGDFDERAVAELEHRLIKVPMGDESEENALASAPKRVGLIVDMAGITRLSIAGLRALIDLRRHWEGSVIVLANLAAQVQAVIELANCLDFFAIYPTLQAAQAALEARRALGLPGQLLKQRYRIEARLGTSEMGAVFKATDLRLDRPVAIKVLSPSFSTNVIARLLREAQRMAQLNNFNIVSIYDWEEEAGLAYLVSEYIAGQTLRQVIEHAQREGDYPVPAALDIAIDILHALEYAHSKGVLHGNLKPENVLLAESLKLTDFGLRWMPEGQALANVPLPLTKADYLAPEQIRGDGIGVQTDLYAFGVILYELCTGVRPFIGVEVIEQQLHEPPVPPRQLNPEMSPSLEHLILKLLAKEPGKRYESAARVRRVLLGIKRHPTTRGTSPGQAKENSAPPSALPLLLAHPHQERLIGREAHLQLLLSLWDQSQGRQGRLAFIAGEAGVGKTRLSKEVATHITEATILAGQCSELEGSPPYLPFIEIGESYLTRTPPPALRQQLGEAASPIALLLPRIRSFLPDLPVLPTLDPEQERYRLMHAFTQFVARAADARPWLLVLDDLHWADPASLQL